LSILVLSAVEGCFLGIFAVFLKEIRETFMNWPNQKKFAFTIVDDTDTATLENVKPVYDFLAELGFRTTKTVWPLAPEGKSKFGGMTCQDEEYLKWLYGLREQGFEIAFHGATDHTSGRQDTVRAIETFTKLFGEDGFLYCAHSGQKESMYWGKYRLAGPRRLIYQLATSRRRGNHFKGHVHGDPLFWGDLCRKHVRYIRNFVYREINTLKVCPEMPYHDPARPYANYWFASSDGAVISSFCKLLSDKKQDCLEREGGLCIVYTHFAFGFCKKGKIDTEFARLMKSLSKRDGWFVPATTILDYLREQPGWAKNISPSRVRELEWKWLITKLLHGSS
jgi:hypothetical protein